MNNNTEKWYELNGEKDEKILKKSKRNIIICTICILLIVLFIIKSIISFCYDVKVSHNIDYYNDLVQNQNYLPSLDELGEYKDYNFKYYQQSALYFTSDSYTLIVSYDEENYMAEKLKLSEKYDFETEFIDFHEEKAFDQEPQFRIDTFDMNLLSDEDFPKEIVFVGTSDDKKEIAYIYYVDYDLDYIDQSFEEFLRDECGWKNNN